MSTLSHLRSSYLLTTNLISTRFDISRAAHNAFVEHGKMPWWWHLHQIDGGSASDVIHGGNGNDIINGHSGDDVLFGGGGNDQINGNAGDDTLYGENGNDILNGGVGNDQLFGGNGNDILNGGADNDYLDDGNGNDVLRGGSGYDYFQQGAGNDVIDGGSGRDMVSYDGFAATAADFVVVDLQRGFASGRISGHDILSNVEDAVGTNAGDTLIGSDEGNALDGAQGNDKIYGLGGDDWIVSGAGNDLVDGGAGTDTIAYVNEFYHGAGPTDFVVVDLANGVADGSFTGHDTLISIENVNTGGGKDTIIGDDNANQLMAGGGDDVVHGGGGDDFIDGEAGNDTIYGDAGINTLRGNDGNDTIVGGDQFDAIMGGKGDDVLDGGGDQNYLVFLDEGGANGATVDFGAGTAIDTFGDHDQISNFTTVLGSMNNDTMIGTSDGTFHMFMGLGGDDTFIAGSNNEFASYWQDADYGGKHGITANLATGEAIDPFDGHDTLTNIRAVHGTQFADHVVGSADNDFLQLGAGDDVVDGGAGFDTMAYSADIFWGAKPDDYIVADLEAGTVVGTFSGQDKVSHIEEIDGTPGNDTLRGDQNDNTLFGGAGDDLIEGRGGNDWLVGEGGSDTFVFGAGFGHDTIEGLGAGDVLTFSSASFSNVNEVISHANENAAGVLIDDGQGDSVQLLGVHLDQLSPSDFLIV